jgi:hypothetical protein
MGDGQARDLRRPARRFRDDGYLVTRRPYGVSTRPPNEMRISCRPSCSRPYKLSFHSAFEEPAARAEPCARPACRLHARVRLRHARGRVVHIGRMVSPWARYLLPQPKWPLHDRPQGDLAPADRAEPQDHDRATRPGDLCTDGLVPAALRDPLAVGRKLRESPRANSTNTARTRRKVLWNLEAGQNGRSQGRRYTGRSRVPSVSLDMQPMPRNRGYSPTPWRLAPREDMRARLQP